MRGGNEGSSVLKPDDWIGYGYLVIMLVMLTNIITVFVWDTDWLAAIGIVITSKHKLVVFIVFAVLCFVNLKHDDSDRMWNFLLFIGFLLTLAGTNLGVGIDASGAAAKMEQAASQAKQRADTGVQRVQQNVTTRQQVAAPQRKVDTNSYYNPYRRNANSGNNYSRCAQLLKNNDLGSYKVQRCNTGAPLPAANVATCRKWETNGGMTDYQAQGCGVKRPTWRGTWCAMNVGQPGQNRQAFCR